MKHLQSFSGQTIAFWWLVFVLFTTGGVMWFLSWIYPPHARWIVTAFKLVHVAAGVGLTIDLIIQLQREGTLREVIRIEVLKEILRVKR